MRCSVAAPRARWTQRAETRPCPQIPTIGFLYVAGYIGYVGRQYLIAVRSGDKPTDKEIIIDVPLAVRLAWQGAGWPLAAVQVTAELLCSRTCKYSGCATSKCLWPCK